MAPEPEPGQEGEEQAGLNGVNGDVTMNGDGEGHVEGEGQADAQPAPSAAGMVGDKQPNKERITTPYLTKYERARVLGTRALQIRCVTVSKVFLVIC